MMHWLGFAAAAMTAGLAEAPPRTETDILQCSVERRSRFGRIVNEATIDTRTGRIHDHLSWSPRRGRDRLWFSVAGSHEAPRGFSDSAEIAVHLRSRARFNGLGRLVIRGPGSPPLLGEVFRPRHFYQASGFRDYRGEFRWGQVLEALGSGTGLQVALVRADGTDEAVDWIERSRIMQAAEAVAAVRPEMERLLASPRRHCGPQRPIIVTGP